MLVGHNRKIQLEYYVIVMLGGQKTINTQMRTLKWMHGNTKIQNKRLSHP